MNWLEKIICKLCPNLIQEKNEYNEVLKQQKAILERILNNSIKIREELHNTCLDVKKVRVELHDEHLRVNELYDKLNKVYDKLNKQVNIDNEIKRAVDETVWAAIFKDTIQNSEWLKDKSLSLGRWAIGYPCAYALYRVLNELHPERVLELGLGQSTKIISQYTDRYKIQKHLVIEHDQNWIDFFEKNYTIPQNTKIAHCPLIYKNYKNVEGIRQFENFDNEIKDEKFELIMIDAPFGGDMPEFARVDVLKNMPKCLSESFVIIFDDCNRKGELHTFEEMKKILDENSVVYKTGTYKGDKTIKVICSENNGFVTSM